MFRLGSLAKSIPDVWVRLRLSVNLLSIDLGDDKQTDGKETISLFENALHASRFPLAAISKPHRPSRTTNKVG